MTIRYTPFIEHYKPGFVCTGHNSMGDPVGFWRKEASTTVGMRQEAEGSYVRYEELAKAEAKIRELERKLAKASKMVGEYKKAYKQAEQG